MDSMPSGRPLTSNSADEFGGWLTKAIAEWGEVVKAENIQVE